MNQSEIKALAGEVAPVVRELLDKATAPLLARIGSLEKRLVEMPAPQDGKDADEGAIIDALTVKIDARSGELLDQVLAAVRADIPAIVSHAVAEIPAPKDGKDADPEVMRAMIADAVAAIPPARDGADADPEMIAAMVDEAVAEIPPPQDGKDADPEVIRAMVADAVAEIPAPQDGRDADPEIIRQMVADAVAEIPPPQDGKDGMLPLCKEWSDRVHYAGEVVTRDGALWQARDATGKSPPHGDWICLAASGRDGAGFTYRGTFAEADAYTAGDVVMASGSSWVAKVDSPGACPGDGWGLMASRGSKGQIVREKTQRQIVKASPVSFDVGEDGVLTLAMDDGQVLSVDLYPLLARRAF